MFRQANQFGQGSDPIFLDQLRCRGDEDRVLECGSGRPLGLHSCSHAEDTGVRCIGKSDQASLSGVAIRTVRLLSTALRIKHI